MSEPTPGAADRLAQLLKSWKTIATVVGSVIVFLVLVGIRFETWQAGLARADDVTALRRESALVSTRTAIVESALERIHQTLEKMDARLFEISRATGARPITLPQGPNP